MAGKAGLYWVLIRSLLAAAQHHVMARLPTWNGEIWTDGHGFATVVLPEAIHGRVSVELRPLAAGVSATLRGQPTRRRFTIETEEPHVKVAWRVRVLGLHGDTYSSKPSKEET